MLSNGPANALYMPTCIALFVQWSFGIHVKTCFEYRLSCHCYATHITE